MGRRLFCSQFPGTARDAASARIGSHPCPVTASTRAPHGVASGRRCCGHGPSVKSRAVALSLQTSITSSRAVMVALISIQRTCRLCVPRAIQPRRRSVTVGSAGRIGLTLPSGFPAATRRACRAILPILGAQTPPDPQGGWGIESLAVFRGSTASDFNVESREIRTAGQRPREMRNDVNSR